MALTAFRKPRPIDADQPADDRPADLVAAESRLAELRRQRAEKQKALRDLQAEFEGEPPVTMARLIAAEIAALNDAVNIARAEVAPLREAQAQAARRPVVSPARRAADAVEKSGRLVKLEGRIAHLKANKRAAEQKLIGARRQEAATVRSNITEIERMIAEARVELVGLRAADAAAVAEALAPMRRDAGRRLLAALGEIETALVEMAEIDDAGTRRKVDPTFPPSAADQFLVQVRAYTARAAR